MRVRAGLMELWRPGEGGLSGKEIWRFGSVLTASEIVVTNLVGAAAVIVIGLLVLPTPHGVHHIGHIRLIDALVAVGYVAIAVPLGVVLGTRRLWGFEVGCARSGLRP